MSLTTRPGSNTRNHDSSFVAGAIPSGGTWNITINWKSLWYSWIERTAHIKLGWHGAPERSQLDNKTWKQLSKSRSTFISGAFHVGGTWNKTTTGRMMRIHVNNKTAQSKLACHDPTPKPPINSEPATVCTRERLSVAGKALLWRVVIGWLLGHGESCCRHRPDEVCQCRIQK
jgi:hypothetical protein